MTTQTILICETRNQAGGRLRSIAKQFGVPEPLWPNDETNRLVIGGDKPVPHVQAEVFESNAACSHGSVQISIKCSNAGHYARVRAALTRRTIGRIEWPG